MGGAEGKGERGRGADGEGGMGKRGRVEGALGRGKRGRGGGVGGTMGERVGVAKARGGRGKGVRGVGRRCNTHYTNYMAPANDQLPTVHSVYISLLPLTHTSTHKGTTHSPSDVALAEVA